MYNGIGLTTPRGTGTNGFVQRNFAFVKKHKENVNYATEEDMRKLEKNVHKTPNQDILEHERKREIEVKLLEYRDEMEEQGYIMTLSILDIQVNLFNLMPC